MRTCSCKFAPLFSITSRMLLPQPLSFHAFASLPGGGYTPVRSRSSVQFLRLEQPLLRLGVSVWNVFAGEEFEFAADDVGGEAGAEKAAVEGGELAIVDFAAEGPQLTLDALADDGGFVGAFGGFFESGLDVAVRDAASAEVAGDAELALLAAFGALASELAGIAGVVDVAVLLEASDDSLDEVFVGGTADEGFFHLGDRMRATHEDFNGGVVQGGFGVELAGLGEHE